jgi:tetratricopeptide (TPR) repeat protein
VLRVRPTAKHSPTSALLLLLFVYLFNMRSSAQMPQQMQDMYAARDMQLMTTIQTAPNTAVIIFHVFAEEKPVKLDRSARLDLTNLGNRYGVFLIVPSHEDAVFTDLIPGKYDISVTAVGYLSTHQEVNVIGPVTLHVDIVVHRDPAAVTLNEASGLMSREAKKAAKRAVSLLKSGQLADAQKHLETVYKLVPSNADLNFLLGYLHFEQRDYAKAGAYLGTAASLSPHSAQALTLLGRTNLLQENYPAAQSALEQAVLADAEDWLPHDLLADAYLNEKEYGKARDEAQTAIAKGVRYGKNASGPAELVLGQALIGLGQKDEGIKALKAFIKESPQNPMVYQVRALITKLKKSDPISAAGGGSIASEINTLPADPLGAVPGPVLSMQTWRPPDIDDAKPTVAPGVTCPSTQVLTEAGKRVQELVRDLARFSADEDVFHESLDGVGLSTHAETRKYSYVAAVSPEPGAVFIEEYRSDKVTQEGDPDAIASTGFVMLALVFHPEKLGDFDFDCEGQSEWHGQPSWLVHFRQRHDRPNHMHGYRVGGESFRVDLKGRAWISADKFQIVRIEADIVNPLHEIQLLSEHETVEYGPVPFAMKNTILWLPKNAEIYFDFRKHHYYRRHSFDHYMLFDVDAEEKDKAPPSTPTSDGSSQEKSSSWELAGPR